MKTMSHKNTVNIKNYDMYFETCHNILAWNHCRTHPAPCVRPGCVCSVLHAHAQFCRFDKADATADVQ